MKTYGEKLGVRPPSVSALAAKDTYSQTVYPLVWRVKQQNSVDNAPPLFKLHEIRVRQGHKHESATTP